ncbi:MAG TPA: hypothetical protein ENH91_15930 [Leeuwenhoekiella sp.]|nr:hypothetical protein [Leeuwenhoekiella sp.]
MFLEVWLKAQGNFDDTKLKGHPELHKIYVELGYEDGKWAYFFNSSIENIYKIFLDLDEAYKDELKEKFHHNNNIEGICKDVAIEPITYRDIAAKQPKLAKELKNFYGKLYGKDSPFNLKIFGFLSTQLITDYDKQFMSANNKGVCPFCALSDLKGNNNSYREAYDHYLPKGLYPFNVLNFHNLSPMCNECNSTYKLQENPIIKIDPITNDKNRTKAFYPYENNHPDVEINIKLKSNDILNLEPADIDLTIVAKGDYVQEIESWKRVFGLEERYKAILCSQNDGKSWFYSIYDEFENAVELGHTNNVETYYQNIVKEAKKIPLSQRGFLKSKFLEECKERGLLDFH